MRSRFERTIRYDCRMRMSRDSHRVQAVREISRALALLASLCALSACVYRMPIQQGNYLDPAVIAQVKPGMTPSQVRYLLGTPMVQPAQTIPTVKPIPLCVPRSMSCAA